MLAYYITCHYCSGWRWKEEPRIIDPNTTTATKSFHFSVSSKIVATNKEAILSNEDEVILTVPKDQLLEYSVADGWCHAPPAGAVYMMICHWGIT